MQIRILFILFQCMYQFLLKFGVIIMIIFDFYEEKYIRKYKNKTIPEWSRNPQKFLSFFISIVDNIIVLQLFPNPGALLIIAKIYPKPAIDKS